MLTRNNFFLEHIHEALLGLHVNESQLLQIYKILSAILHLGNIKFEDEPSNENCKTSESTIEPFNIAAELLGVKGTGLLNIITRRHIQIKNEDPIS